MNRCITLAEEIAGHCTQGLTNLETTARVLLRDLKIDKHLAIMMRSHPNDVPGIYMTLLESTLNLTVLLRRRRSGLAASNRWIHGVYAMPLFAGGHAGGDPELTHAERQDVMLAVARVLPKVFSGNRELVIAHASLLVAKTVEAIRVFGKHHVLLDVLNVLVQVDGRSVEYAQTQVSKGLIEKSQRALDCALDEDEWEKVDESDAGHCARDAGDSADGQQNRARQELKYYSTMMQLMGLCARG